MAQRTRLSVQDEKRNIAVIFQLNEVSYRSVFLKSLKGDLMQATRESKVHDFTR